MPEPTPPAADRNLLFGVLALQMDFVSRDQLVAAMHAWVLDKAKPLGHILVDQLALSPARRALLEPLVEEHIGQHGHDPERSLAALSLAPPLRRELDKLADRDVGASLALVPDDPGRTAAYNPPGDGSARYQVLRPHARGGLGEVFIALDGELQREVALKEIGREQADDPDSRGRFVQEAEITGKLEHPGVVPVYGLGAHADGRPFYAMRFVRGQTLKEAIARFHGASAAGDRSTELGLRGLLGRFVAVCNTIAYAHSRGVLHRDLKPSNILLGPYGETLVVDWGLAKTLGSGSGLAERAEPTLLPQLAEGAAATQAGAALGTPAYMSPEQASGRLDQLGPASDVYGLGATLYSMLTGRPPIEAKDTAEVLRKAQRGESLPPRQVKSDVPAALDAVCRKAMAPRPEQRYGSALELAADVEQWLADEPVSAYRDPWAARARRWGRRHRALVTAALAVLAVSVAGLAAGLVLLAGAAEEQAKARRFAEIKEDEAKTRAEETRRVLYLAEMNLAQRECEAGNFDHVRELLGQYGSWPPGAEDLRGFEWHYLNRLAHRAVLALKGHKGMILGMAFSPDGHRLATTDVGVVRVWDAAGGREVLTLKGHRGLVQGVAWSPDGRRLASAGDTVRLWDATSGREVLTLKGHAHGVLGVAWSPDGRRLASSGSDGTLRVWDAASGRELLTLKAHRGQVRGVAFSPHGRRLASAGLDGAVRLWDAASGREVFTLKGHADSVRAVTWSPRGRRLASAGADGTVRVWDAASGREVLTLRGHAGTVYSVAYSPDGRRLASAVADGTIRLWEAVSGREVLTLKGHAGLVLSVAFSPDGRRLATAGLDGAVRLWDAASSLEALTLRLQPGTVPAVAWSPDDRLATTDEGVVRVWDAASGRELLTLKGYLAAWGPDGRCLASAGPDGRVRVWDAASGRELLTLQRHGGINQSWWGMGYSPDGRRLAGVDGDGTVWLWDAASGRQVLAFKAHAGQVYGLAYSPDGRRLAGAGGDGSVRLWDAASGRQVLALRGHTGPVVSVAFSPDGRRLASAGGDGSVRLWDAASGREVLTLKGHAHGVQGVAWSPDGRRLASAGIDGSVRLWDAASGREVLALRHPTAREGPRGEFTSVAFSADGRRLASAGNDGTVEVWETFVSAPDMRRREIVALVHDRFDQLLLRWEVLASLRKDTFLNATDRALAIQVAQTRAYKASPSQLNQAAWEVVKAPGRDREAYALAARQAQAAVQAAPGDGYILNTLGVAHYRLGEFAKAVETLKQSEKLNTTKDGPAPMDLAFLAMAQHRLGQQEPARITLRRLREAMKQPGWINDAESQGFLREAEELLRAKGKNAPK
jgi:WD40 repeat protein